MKKEIFLIIFLLLFLSIGTPLALATITLGFNGWSDQTVGTWDENTKTGTLTQDLTEDVEIISDDITLDGNGHTIAGSGSGNGISLNGRTGVTVKNTHIEGFTNGIRLDDYCYSNTLTGNTANSNGHSGLFLDGHTEEIGSRDNTVTDNTADSNGVFGILVRYSDGNTVSGNTVSGTGEAGISIEYSRNNEVTGNNASNNKNGIYLYHERCQANTVENNIANSNTSAGIVLHWNPSNNTVTGNVASDNRLGIHLTDAGNNEVTGNTALNNTYGGILLDFNAENTVTDNAISGSEYGIRLTSASDNTLTGNTVSHNHFGIYLWDYLEGNASDNKVYNNNFIDNTIQADTDISGGNVFNLDKPFGGNYWDDWTTPDVDGDGFVDNPYVFDGGQDDLPWAIQDGWELPVPCSAEMVSYWRFDEGGGTTAADSVSGNHGTIYGATWTAGILGGALAFDGANDYAAFPTSGFGNITTYTVEMWLKPTASKIVHIWEESALSAPSLEGAVGYSNLNYWVGNTAHLDTGTLNVGEWYHVVATYDKSTTTQSLYFNGVLKGTNSVNVSDTFGSTLYLATRPGHGRYYPGLIDEVAIYNKALTVEEVQHHYQKGLSGLGYCEPDAVPLTIAATTPAANELNVAANTDIVVQFSDNVNGATVNANTFNVDGSQSGQHTGTFSGGGTDTITLSPDVGFAPGEIVTVTLTTGIQSTGGQPLSNPVTWQFTVAASGSGLFSATSQSLGSSWSYEVKLGDVDGDGDLDAFVANYGNQANKVWLNDGSGNFTDSGQNLGSLNSTGVAFGDVDGDGDLDAFVANYYGQANKVWLNDGSGNFIDSGQNLGGSNSNAVALGDADGDGDLDAFVANEGSNKVWLNDGSGNFIDSGQNLGSSSNYAVALGDVDSDGDLDAFVVNYDGQANRVWLNDGSGNFTDSGQNLGSPFGMGIALGDMDGDNDLDAFVVVANEPNKVWLNGTSPAITSKTPSANELNVVANTDIVVQFSNNIDGATVNADTFNVDGSQTGQHTGTFSGGGTDTITFSPDVGFAPGEVVTVMLTTGIQSTGGQPLSNPVTWQFTVAATGNGDFCPAEMVSYWKFDEGSGTTASDSLNGNHGAIYGATWTTGRVGGALAFDGINDYIDLGNLGNMGRFSLSLWIKPDSVSGTQRFIGKGHSCVNWTSLSLVNDHIQMLVWDSIGNTSLDSAVGSISVDNWYHVVGTHDGTNIKLYLNGTEVDSDTKVFSLDDSQNFILGRNAEYAIEHFKGTIDEVAIYNRALTIGEVQQHYQWGLAGLGYCESGPSPPPETQLTARVHVKLAIYEATSSAGAEVPLDGSQSIGSDGNPITSDVTCEWDFDYDGNFQSDATGKTVTHTYSIGEHTAALRITDASGSSVDTVNIKVQDTKLPIVKLLSPHGGESYKGGETVSIRWEQATDIAGFSVEFPNKVITLRYSVDGGGWQLIAQDEANDGQYDWTVPVTNSANIRLKIEAKDGAGNIGENTSPDAFTIDSVAPAVTLTAPNGGDVLRGGSVFTITWDLATDGFGLTDAPIRLSYSIDGVNWLLIAEGQLNDGQFDWNVPEDDSESLLVRIEVVDRAGNVGADVSGSPSSMDNTAPTVVLNYPNGGEPLKGGDSVEITWQLAVDVHLSLRPINLFYSLVGLDGWIPIAENLPNGGSYPWIVPQVNSESVRVKVVAVDVVGNIGEYILDMALTIDSDSPTSRLTLIAPSKEETQHLRGGHTYAIVWALPQDNSGLAEVALSYSDDGGTNWHSIAQVTNAGGTYGRYDWAVPTLDVQIMLRIEATDASGNRTEDTSSNHVVDSSAPYAPLPNSLNSPTAQNVIIITGEAEVESQVSLLRNQNPIASTQADATTGRFSFTTEPLADGLHSFTTTTTDAAGNVSSDSSLEVVVDTVPPDRPIAVSPADSVTVNVSPTLEWEAISDTTAVTYRVQVGNEPLFASPEVDVSGIVDIQLILTLSVDGLWFWRVQAIDAVGHAGDFSPVFQFTLDTLAPVAPTILSPETGMILREATVTISGTAEVGIQVDIYANGQRLGSVIADADGKFALVVQGLDEDGYTLTAISIDAAGNESDVSVSVTLVVDFTSPGPPVFSAPASGTVTNQNVLPIEGTAEVGSTVTLMDNGEISGTVATRANGSFSYKTRPLADGIHSLTATATDVAGNVSEEVLVAITVTIDTAAPAVSVSLNKQEYTTNESIQIEYTVHDNIDVSVSVVITTTPNLTVADNEIQPPLPAGSLTVTITVTDEAGNSASASVSAVVKALVASLDVIPNLFEIKMPKTPKKDKDKKSKKDKDDDDDDDDDDNDDGGDDDDDDDKTLIVLTSYISLPEGISISEIDTSFLRLNDSLSPRNTIVHDAVLEAQFKVNKAFVAALLSLDVTLVDKLRQNANDIRVFLNEPVEMASITLGKLQVTGTLNDQAAFASDDASRQITLKEYAAPKATRTLLAQNFPNPFNPETWIPYALVSDAQVTIRIFDVRGNLVRRLALGYQEAGFYIERNEAAYWNGRNGTGEQVSSGVYFYTLEAGAFAATRKMVILR